LASLKLSQDRASGAKEFAELVGGSGGGLPGELVGEHALVQLDPAAGETRLQVAEVGIIGAVLPAAFGDQLGSGARGLREPRLRRQLPA